MKKNGHGYKVLQVKIGDVIPYDKNPRTRSDEVIAGVARSIQEFGFRQPIVTDKKLVVIVGHTRLLAAHKLGLAEVPVHIAEKLSADQVRAYRIADNRTNEGAEWDQVLLKLELEDLRGADYD